MVGIGRDQSKSPIHELSDTWNAMPWGRDMELRGGHRKGDIARLGVVLESAAQVGERFHKLISDAGGENRPRQSEKKGRSLFIGSRLRPEQGYVPGNQARFKMSKGIFVGVGSQRPFSGE